MFTLKLLFIFLLYFPSDHLHAVWITVSRLISSRRVWMIYPFRDTTTNMWCYIHRHRPRSQTVWTPDAYITDMGTVMHQFDQHRVIYDTCGESARLTVTL